MHIQPWMWPKELGPISPATRRLRKKQDLNSAFLNDTEVRTTIMRQAHISWTADSLIHLTPIDTVIFLLPSLCLTVLIWGCRELDQMHSTQTAEEPGLQESCHLSSGRIFLPEDVERCYFFLFYLQRQWAKHLAFQRLTWMMTRVGDTGTCYSARLHESLFILKNNEARALLLNSRMRPTCQAGAVDASPWTDCRMRCIGKAVSWDFCG